MAQLLLLLLLTGVEVTGRGGDLGVVAAGRGGLCCCTQQLLVDVAVDESPTAEDEIPLVGGGGGGGCRVGVRGAGTTTGGALLQTPSTPEVERVNLGGDKGGGVLAVAGGSSGIVPSSTRTTTGCSSPKPEAPLLSSS